MGWFTELFKSGPPKHVHDWEVVKTEDSWKIEWRVDSETSDGPPRPPTFASIYHNGTPKQCVCITCGARIDEIAEYEKRYREEKKRLEYRRQKARSMWDDANGVT